MLTEARVLLWRRSRTVCLSPLETLMLWVGLKAGNFNAEFMQPTRFDGNAFMPWIGGDLDDILCERFERIVGCDNCVSFVGMKLQIPADCYRCRYVKAKVSVLRRINGHPAVLHGARKLAEYEAG